MHLEGWQCLQFAVDAAEAVAGLHQHGIIHSHIQLRNFLVTPEQRLYIIDFAGSTSNGVTGNAEAPYKDKDDDEAIQLFSNGNCSWTEEFLCGSVVLRCWTGLYKSAQEMLKDITVLLDGWIVYRILPWSDSRHGVLLLLLLLFSLHACL